MGCSELDYNIMKNTVQLKNINYKIIRPIKNKDGLKLVCKENPSVA